MYKKFSLAMAILFVTIGIWKTRDSHPLYLSSNSLPIEDYTSFAEYQLKTRQFVKENRYFLTDNHQQEIDANSPFEIKPSNVITGKTKGILLVHGLGDSPYSYIDIAKDLAKRGFLVRAVLLAGHGTKPGDMLNVSHLDWEKVIAKQVEILKKEVDEVYLGGFSTGGNLVYAYAQKDNDIRGLALFAPAFELRRPIAGLAVFRQPFKQWVLRNTPQNTTNYVRYVSMTTKGFVEYLATRKEAAFTLARNKFDRPVYMVLSEHDSVLNTQKIRKIFSKQFTHPDNRLMWFGANPSKKTKKITYVNSRVPELRVTNMSHVGIMFAPDNPYYGVNGSEKICHNNDRLSSEQDTAYCKEGNPVWFAEWNTQEGLRVHARSTFNPDFTLMMDELASVLLN